MTFLGYMESAIYLPWGVCIPFKEGIFIQVQTIKCLVSYTEYKGNEFSKAMFLKGWVGTTLSTDIVKKEKIAFFPTGYTNCRKTAPWHSVSSLQVNFPFK
jgi:hypothetical protein